MGMVACSGLFLVPAVVSFPLVVHQLWTPGGEPSSLKLRKAMAEWRQQEPQIRYALWNDTTAAAILLRHGGKTALAAYQDFAPAQKKDFFMYVVLAEEGGLFVDCDVRPLQPPGRWLREFATRGDEVLLGLEAHGSRRQQKIHRWASPTQICVWAAASRQNSTVMRQAAGAILRAHQNRALTSDYMSTILSTGPGLLTRVVTAELAKEGVTLEDFASVRGGRQSDAQRGIRILGINAFGCGQEHSGSSSCENAAAAGVALVQHDFAGTWKWQLCSNSTGKDFEQFALLHGWDAEAWYSDLRQQHVWRTCGVPSPDSNLAALHPLLAPVYPPQLLAPPYWGMPLCELIFDSCEAPLMLPGPLLQDQRDEAGETDLVDITGAINDLEEIVLL